MSAKVLEHVSGLKREIESIVPHNSAFVLLSMSETGQSSLFLRFFLHGWPLLWGICF